MANNPSNPQEEEEINEELNLEEESTEEQDTEGENPEGEEIEREEKADDPAFAGEAKNWMPVDRELPLMTDKEYMKERVEDQIEWYNRKSSLNQQKYKLIKKRDIIISSVIPVIISFSAVGAVEALNFEFTLHNRTATIGLNTVFQITAAVAGVFLVIFNKVIDLEEYYKLWKDYRSTCEALQHERLMYLTRTEPYDEDDAFPILVDKIESILNNETQKWKQKPQAQQQQPQGAKQKPQAPQKGPDEA